MFKNVVGLVVEYNPFHNGHLHHIQEIDKLFEDNIKIAVMSGDFVQRGEPSLLNKFEKTKVALSHGIDIVIELPAFYSCQSAEIFARGSVDILNKLFCTAMVFGSETNNLENLKKIIDYSSSENFSLDLKKYLQEGLSYPTSYAKALENCEEEKINPNDILALEYLKAIKVLNSKIIPHSIKREKVGYFGDEKENFASASYIRKKILSLDKDKINLSFAKDLVPKFSFDTLEKNFFYLISLENFYDLIRYEILKNKENLKNIQDMEVGLENRLYESALKNLDFNCFFNEILSKRLTISRLQRILLHILLGLTKDVTNNTKFSIPFVKILGFSKKGQEYLNFLKKTDSYKANKILTSNRNLKEFLNEEEKFLFEFNERCSQIYRIKSNYDNLNYPIIFKGD